MANSPPEKFPQIRVFGSIGWFLSVLFSVVALHVFGAKIDATRIHGMNIPLVCGAAVSLVGALVALTLPDTPPPARSVSYGMAGGFTPIRQFTGINPRFIPFLLVQAVTFTSLQRRIVLTLLKR